MEPEQKQDQPVCIASPSTDALLEHHLIKSHEDAGKTHQLLEHHLVKAADHAEHSQSLSENQIEIQARILQTLSDIKELLTAIVERPPG